MHTDNIFNFEYSYLSLPDRFYSLVHPTVAGQSEMVLKNAALLKELGIPTDQTTRLLAVLSGNEVPSNSTPFAQAYAGHQFGHFTMLGDGRAIILGEHKTADFKRYDIQLKGSGPTPYSRSGDGRGTLKSMLREYLMSEAMYHLRIPTSRSLAVVKTKGPVYRESIHPGAVLTRLMESHIRIGTFEYASYFGGTDDLKALVNYSIQRLFPEIGQDENPVLSLLQKVMDLQIDLVVNWMRVGFIHGVMNTDNVAISGETFDYGPCAFMNAYHPETVFSSIDAHGRYAFANQPGIIKWNLARLAEALLPLLHKEADKALVMAQQAIEQFDEHWKDRYYRTMLHKLGIENRTTEDEGLVDELLELMKVLKLDYTNTFSALSRGAEGTVNPQDHPALKPWLEKWQISVSKNSQGLDTAKSIMKAYNPVFIPRNHLVEEALDAATAGDLSLIERMLHILATPYEDQANCENYKTPPESDFEANYQTFCGT
ncbi:protein adenylyltransferase SelO [Geofilum rubicundum]|uniref:Protein nucleotidyltransferase YdiU n=1 Tax=Geofilum rubicundum JCM 15548 TaxID=1236989 RepID=A0A0E9LS00_9BACT|nr:YdiU family protein [Geofilum rubicundum]GAO28068.1 selenoprotein O and cysteine-containing homologs [Geofilum rubicundum JCM 15548]